MKTNLLWQLGVFVLVLIALNAVFQLHISIIGSLLLTVLLSFVFNLIQSRR